MVESQPFGGEGLSGTGPKEGGPHYVARFATERVTCIDTTAAGDSFAAAYLAARLAGADPVEAARAGHRLAGVVVCYPGAIIPRSAMPDLGIIQRKGSK